VHPTLGILARFQAFFYALAFFWLDGFAVPAPARVTQTVGLLNKFCATISGSKDEESLVNHSRLRFNM
jgi:hypothetical protein